jgi:hypothetical protein
VDKQRFYGRISDFMVEFESWLDQVDGHYAGIQEIQISLSIDKIN